MIAKVLKHKKDIKHKELLPWELHPPGSSRVERYPRDFDRKKYKSHLMADVFAWMVYSACQDNSNFDITEIINYWWRYVYTKDFPEKGGLLDDLTERIYQSLVDRGHDSIKISPEESDYNLPKFLIDNGQWYKKKKLVIHEISIEEVFMAKIVLKKKATANSGASSKDAKTQKGSQKAPAKGAGKSSEKVKGDSDTPKWIANSRPGTKAHESKVRCCELLLERKHTDEEIALIIESELDYKIDAEHRVNFYRYTLNKGRFAALGFETPNPPVEKIEASGAKKSAPIAKGKADAKGKAEKPKAPAKASAVKKSIEKKSSGKKIILKKK